MVLLGAQLEQMIPFAAAYEMIRQRRQNLSLVGPISDALFDQMIGAGTVERVMAAWVGNASQGLGQCFRRAVEQSIPNAIATVDYTNFTLALALHAAALGVPFLPTYSAQGSEILKQNANLREFASPVSEEKLIAVRALKPDVAIIHVQRADRFGNAHLWGNFGVAVDGARASRKVIITAEEIVEPEVIASDPNRTLIPGFTVSAVVRAFRGERTLRRCKATMDAIMLFSPTIISAAAPRTGFASWLAEWLMGPASRAAYLAQLGDARRESLTVKKHAYSAAADFGY